MISSVLLFLHHFCLNFPLNLETVGQQPFSIKSSDPLKHISSVDKLIFCAIKLGLTEPPSKINGPLGVHLWSLQRSNGKRVPFAWIITTLCTPSLFLTRTSTEIARFEPLRIQRMFVSFHFARISRSRVHVSF